ncbi:rhodanese-like domain-containing protein [Prosthecobacter dejongeii]|uniref:Rhodanese-related sulfurtransferase n=1 Tax=Prosthecobacter dejongeii TaxID=48465 RepID=A0A7W7YPV3_9BACT|nr:rhodanese-like domain-containing protein [Prosthecobacter dejongeii]MBB5040049.1 rhodanese-related sulfurtransferase [Prosthecobacter dejongeii]
MKRLSFIAALCVLPLAGFAEDKVKHVDAEKAAKLVAEGKVTVLDVRTEEEYKEGHIKGATNVDILSKDFVKKLEAANKTKPVLVHCQAGGRSTRSLPKLEQAGFTEIYHLDGGMADWVKADKPVEK